MPTKADYWKNPEKYRAKTRAYALQHPDWKREENKNYMRRKHYQLGKTGVALKSLAEKKRDPVGYLLKHAEIRARKFGLPFSLKREDLTMPDVCPVFGTAWEWGIGRKGWSNLRAPSLDRVDPTLGYVPGNVEIISNRANHLKSNGWLDEMEAVVAYMQRAGCPRKRTESAAYIPHIFDEPDMQMDLPF